MEVAVIAAVADNGVIGREGGLPWDHPEDLRHFKETTMGHPVVVGRVTYEGIVDRLGGPLPGRTTVVLTSRDLDVPEGVVLARSVEDALAAAAAALDDPEDGFAYVAGGASVYEQFLARADRLVLTEVHESPAGDARFPPVDWDAWVETDRDDRGDLSFVVYERRD